jgi:hypothetical protein
VRELRPTIGAVTPADRQRYRVDRRRVEPERCSFATGLVRSESTQIVKALARDMRAIRAKQASRMEQRGSIVARKQVLPPVVWLGIARPRIT